MSVTAILDLQFRADRLDEALALFGRVLQDTRAFEGCESVVLIQDQTDPTHVVAVETWASSEADAAYRQWRAGEGAITELPPLLAAAPRLTVGPAVEGV